ncbi:MAG: ABC transporter ATP-binding protein [Desulfurococcales archaeon]|nr:ABC transporter ATP-binding protein [Desulfurococcales archaeon]
MKEPVVVLRNVWKTYREGGRTVIILKNVSTTIYRKEIVGVHGPSGAGKTTLLKLIAGLERPDRGEVIVDGYNLNMLDDLGLAMIRNTVVAYIPQDYGLITDFTVWENVELPLLIAGVDKGEREKKIYEALEYMGLLDKAHVTPRKLSGGERQRVAIARALVTTPSVLLADEPTANLDWENAVKVADLLHQVSSDFDTTVIIVTHDPRLLEYVDRSMNLIDGVLKDKEGVTYEGLKR